MKLRYKEIKFEFISNIDEILQKIFYVDKYYSVLREYKFSDVVFCFENNAVDYIYSDFDMNNEFTATLSVKQIVELVETGSSRGVFYTDEVKAKERLEELEKEEEAHETIKQALTPPTAKEVCKALSERYNNAGIRYFKDKKSFVHGYLLRIICCLKKDGTVYWGTDDLTPHLTAMIGKFYESLEEKK